MRRLPLFAVLFLAAACGESPRMRFKPPLEGQSPPAPAELATIPGLPPGPPAPDSALLFSPVWLRANSPVQWTCPPGWEEIQSTKPQRIVEFTIEKNGPGNAPIQFLILNGADEHPRARQATFDRWETFFHADTAPSETPIDHDGLKGARKKVHGEYDGPPVLGASESIKEPNWTMIFGWVEGPSGSIMFRVQGPDAIIRANEAKVDQLLASMRPVEKKQ